MKKLIASLLVAASLMGSSVSAMAVEAKCPPHDFCNMSYEGTRTETRTHDYVYGYFPDGTVETRKCKYQVTVVRLCYTCKDCGAYSNRYEDKDYGESGHDCGK